MKTCAIEISENIEGIFYRYHFFSLKNSANFHKFKQNNNSRHSSLFVPSICTSFRIEIMTDNNKNNTEVSAAAVAVAVAAVTVAAVVVVGIELPIAAEDDADGITTEEEQALVPAASAVAPPRRPLDKNPTDTNHSRALVPTMTVPKDNNTNITDLFSDGPQNETVNYFWTPSP